MNQAHNIDRNKKYILIFIICLAVMQLIMQTTLLTKGPEFLSSSIVCDDTYYYVLTAWNTKQTGTVTFDGIHSTNGVQLLWFWIVYLLSFLAACKTTHFLLVLAACFLLNVLCYIPIWKFGHLTGRPALSVLLASFWALLVVDGVYWLGLENSLHAFILWCVVWQYASFFVTLHRGKKPNLIILTALLVLNAATRLDAAALSSIFYVFALSMVIRKHSMRKLPRGYYEQVWISLLVALAGVVTVFGVYNSMGGSFIPVSALIKTSLSGDTIPLLDEIHRLFVFSIPPILPHRIGSHNIKTIMGILALILLVVPSSSNEKTIDKYNWFNISLNVSTTMCLAIAAYYIIIIVFDIQHHEYFIWYQSPSFIFWIIILSRALCRFIDTAVYVSVRYILTLRARIERHSASYTYIADRGIYLFCLALIALSVIRFTTTPDANPRSIGYIRYHAALWVDKNLPKDAICAAWNSGQMAFYSNRTTINLDGLINSIDYYNDVLRGPVSLDSYLKANHIDYIIDYHDNDLTRSLNTIHEFEPSMQNECIKVMSLY